MGGRKNKGRRALFVLVSVLCTVTADLLLPTVAVAGPASKARAREVHRAEASGAAPATTAPAMSAVGDIPLQPYGTTLQGALAKRTSIDLTIVLRSSNPSGLAATAAAVSNPGSPEFHHYLSPAEVTQQFGPPQQTTEAIDSYLTSYGLTVGPTLGDGAVVTASGTASDVSEAFHTGLMVYRQSTGRIVYANSAPPSIPSSIAPAIETVSGLDDTGQFVPQLVRGASSTSPTSSTSATGASPKATVPVSSGATPCSAASSTASSTSAYTADELAKTYGLETAYKAKDFGQGVTVGVVEFAGFSRTDVSTFEQCYGIKTKVKTDSIGRLSPGSQKSSGPLEADLDIENVASLAPSSKVLVYQGPNSDAGALSIYGMIATSPNAQIVSTSWGQCEPSLFQSYYDGENSIFQRIASEGVTVVAASGDTGSQDCLDVPGIPPSEATCTCVDDPGSQPTGVTSIGGTDLVSAGSSPNETVWNDGDGAGGGGISQLWQMQNWQIGPGVINSYSTADANCGYNLCREVPDVSASASPNNGYVTYCTVGSECQNSFKGWSSVGGTSGAAPLWAALFALVDSALASTGQSPVGFANPVLYEIGANPSQQKAFNDITSGNNDPVAIGGVNNGLYPAGPRYDLASGLGSPNGKYLLKFLEQGG